MTTWIILGLDHVDDSLLVLVETGDLGTDSEVIPNDLTVPLKAKRYTSPREAGPDLQFLFRQDERYFPSFRPFLGIEKNGHVEALPVRVGKGSEAREMFQSLIGSYGIPVIEHAEA